MFSINGIVWYIYFVPYNSKYLQKRDGTFALGACSDREKSIYIRDDLDCAYKRKVLCHELTHAAMFSYHIYLDDYTEELLADLFATYGEQIINLSRGTAVC